MVETVETYLSRTESVCKDQLLTVVLLQTTSGSVESYYFPMDSWCDEYVVKRYQCFWSTQQKRGSIVCRRQLSCTNGNHIDNSSGWTDANTFATFYQRHAVVQDDGPSVYSTIQSGSLSQNKFLAKSRPIVAQ